MATIGQQLPQPENGWKRYDDTDNNVSYFGDFRTYSSAEGYYKNTVIQIQNNGKIKFNFTGSKLRIISCYALTQEGCKLLIDEIDYNNLITKYDLKSQVLIFDKSDLPNREHFVEIIPINNGKFQFDAIDIDENEELRSYNPNLKKYLIKQNSNYYSINNNYIDLGIINNDKELKTIIDEHGYNDLSILTKELNSKKIPTKLENDYYKSFDINLNDIKDNINLIEENDKKYIEYSCSNYKISDKIKEINNGKFEVLMRK